MMAASRFWYSFSSVALRVGIVGLLATSAAIKFLHGYDPQYWLDMELYYGLSVAEVALCVLVWSRWRELSLWLLIGGLALVGMYLVLRGESAGVCGCFGSWPMSRRVHLVIISALGLMAIGVQWVEHRFSVREQPESGALSCSGPRVLDQ